MTDAKLKQALAKMLPETVEYRDDDLYWVADRGYEIIQRVLETELMHLCALAEKGLRPIKQKRYYRLLREKLGSYELAISATWQQRATALAKVEGIEV